MFCSPPGNYANLSYLKENFNLRISKDFSILYAWVLVFDSMLYNVTIVILNLEFKSLTYSKKALNCLII